MKMLLIATTALVCVTSLAEAGSLPESQTGSGHGALTANDEFLCTYGFKLYDSNADDSFAFDWKRAAAPIVGKGKSVNEIVVANGPSAGPHIGFKVAIYSSRRNQPDKELVAASAGQRGCGRVMVPISSITLERGKKYWIVQSVPAGHSSSLHSILWVYDKRRSHGALSQPGSRFCASVCSSHVGPWKPIAGGVPYARVSESVGVSELNRFPLSQGAGDDSAFPAFAPIRRGGHEGGIPRYPP